MVEAQQKSNLADWFATPKGEYVLRWEQAQFDSDQAVFGLMAKHLAEGRAFPVFMYGQSYILAVESWMLRGVNLPFGSSVICLARKPA